MLHGSHGYCLASETNPGGHSEHSQAPKLDVEPDAGKQSDSGVEIVYLVLVIV